MFLAYQQKMAAIELKHFRGYKWEPKKGDYFTNITNDFDLYQILDDEGNIFSVLNTDGQAKVVNWLKEDFLNGDFFQHRVHIPNYLLKFY